jgi:hypothetical protein
VREIWVGVSLLGTLEAIQNISKKALEMEHQSVYRGYVRGTWREGSYIEVSEKHVMEGSGKGAFLLYGDIGEFWHLAWEC